jgi:hypothetical protein
MQENTKKIHQPKSTLRAKWKYDVENDIRQKKIFNWSQVARDTDGWKRATGEALFLLL